MLCPDSDIFRRAGSQPCAPKIEAFSRQSANCSSVAAKSCSMDLNTASKVLRSDSIALIGWPRGVSFVLPWCSANPAILGGLSATLTLPDYERVARDPGTITD
jgi:hypothetical protein